MSSWLDLVKTDYVIKTGDAFTYKPLWLNARKSKKFNISQFEFKGINGSLVKKGNPQARVYDIEIYFQGADHMDQAKLFDLSSDDPNPWTITHPLYGSLYVQCSELSFDNTQMNVSKIIGTVIETILDSGPQVSQPDIVAGKVNTNKSTFAQSYAATVVTPSPSDLQRMLNDINGAYAAVSAQIANVQEDVSDYQNALNAAISVLNTVTYDSEQIASQIQSLILAPAYFVDTVKARIAMFADTAAVFDQDVTTILSAYGINTQSLKKLYENNGGANILGMCLCTVNNITSDYQYMPDVLNIIADVVNGYNSYINNLIQLQTPTGGQLNSYIPDANSLIGLQQVVFYTIAYLYGVSAGAKQQRTYIPVYDDNLINIVYALYGSDPDDSLKLTFIGNNNLTMDELLEIKAGRKLVYYV